jgi:MFS transporter, ACDE family, multidrug resistance protein
MNAAFMPYRAALAGRCRGSDETGHILLHAADHGAAGRMVAEYANTVGASTIVVGAPTHGGLPALMDDSATRGLSRLARSNVLVVNPDAPAGVPAEDLWGELAKD